MAQLDYDTAAVKPDEGFSPLPPNTYTLVVSSSDQKQTASGRGSYLQFDCIVSEGEFMNRKVWLRFNTKNASADAERIGRAQFSAFHRACGLERVIDTTELHGRVFRCQVGIKKRKDTGQDEQSYLKYEPVGGAAQASQPAAQPWQQPAAAAPQQPVFSGVVPAASNETPPWLAKQA